MEDDENEMYETAQNYAHRYTGGESEDAAIKFLDRFPLPVIFDALQNLSNMEGLGNALVESLEVVCKTIYGASFIPMYMPLIGVGLKSHFSEIRALACKAVDCLLLGYHGTKEYPVRLIVRYGIYPLLLDCVTDSDDEVARAAVEAIKSLAYFQDAMSVIFPAENDATHLRNIAARFSGQARLQLMFLIVKLFRVSREMSLTLQYWGLHTLLETEMKTTNDPVVLLKVLGFYHELLPMERSPEILPQTSLIQLLCSVISGPSLEPNLKVRAFMVSGRLLEREDIYTTESTVDEACVKALISAIDGSLESREMSYIEERAALGTLGRIGSTTRGANLVLSTSSPAARHVVASALDCNAYLKREAALRALVHIAGKKWSSSGKIVDGKAEESLRRLIYDVAAESTELTPSGLFLSVLQSLKFRYGVYRALAALAARRWFLLEVLSNEEIINMLTTETSGIVTYCCCKAILEAFVSNNFVNAPHHVKIVEKLQEAVQREI